LITFRCVVASPALLSEARFLRALLRGRAAGDIIALQRDDSAGSPAGK
jgi:hypothetical protein